jgi:hypothetical protein
MVDFDEQDLRGSQFTLCNLSGSRFRDVELNDVKVTGAFVDRVDISGVLGSLTVDGIDVSAYVRAEIDRRYPERRLLDADDAAGLRAAWAMIEQQADATLARARALAEPKVYESVDGEWSYVDTLRHLVFATDRWITGPVLGAAEPFHRLGRPHNGALEPRTHTFDAHPRPPLDAVLAARRQRMASVRELLAASSPDDLQRTVENPNGGTTTVTRCIRVVLGEEWQHNRFANRDLDSLERT